MAALTPPPKLQFFDANGNPLVGGKLYSYAAGTTTPLATYTDATGTVPNANPVILDSRGEAAVWLGAAAYKLRLTNASNVDIWTVDDVAGAATLADLAASGGSSLVGFLQAGTGAVTRTVQSKLRETLSVFDFMSSAQIAAVEAYTFSTDVTAACQAALDAARASNKDCYFPAGGYLVTGLTIPGTTGGPDDRDGAIRVYGQGTGEAFVLADTGGTVIKSVTNAPVMKDILGTDPSSNGTVEIDHIRFVGTSNANIPVVQLESFYGMSTIHHCVFYQNGAGDGLNIGFSATTHIYQNYCLNSDWLTPHVATRTGKGFYYIPTYDGGLVTFSKNTSRGWNVGYRIGGGAGTPYSPTIRDCECSVVTNGIELFGTRKATIDANYMEGIDGGKAVYINGNYTTVSNNLIFAGSSVVIDDRVTTNVGTVISGNQISIGAVASAIGVGVAGVFGRAVIGNSITRTAGTANQTGIYVDVQTGKLTLEGNSFDPRQAWTGSGSVKVSYTSASDMYGVIIGQSSTDDFPHLSQGAVSFFSNSLTEANVASNILTVPDGSYFVVTAGSAVTVNRLEAGDRSGRLITFRTTNANMTFADTAYISSAGAFTGPGTITFIVERLGGASYAREVSRTVF